MTVSPSSREQELWTAILSLQTPAECQKFFGDLLTADEVTDFAKRWQVARMLFAGISYKSIQDETALSSRTIARISNWLKEGTGGYRLLLKRTDVVNSHHTVLTSPRRRTAH